MSQEINRTEIEHFLQGNGEFLYLPDEVWEAAEAGRFPLEEMLLELPVSQWMVMVMVLEAANSLEKWDGLQAKLRTIRTREDIRYDYFDMHEANCLMEIGVQSDTLAAAEGVLHFFAESNMRYARKIYTEQAFHSAMDIMPESIRAAYWVEKAFALDAGQHEKRLGYLKQAVETWPLLGATVKNYALLLGQEEDRKVKEADAAGKQLNAMAVEVKKQLAVLMENGMYAEAYSVVQQLRQMLPADEELVDWEKEIERRFS